MKKPTKPKKPKFIPAPEKYETVEDFIVKIDNHDTLNIGDILRLKDIRPSEVNWNKTIINVEVYGDNDYYSDSYFIHFFLNSPMKVIKDNFKLRQESYERYLKQTEMYDKKLKQYEIDLAAYNKWLKEKEMKEEEGRVKMAKEYLIEKGYKIS